MTVKVRVSGLKAFVAVVTVFIAVTVFQGGQIQELIKDTREAASQFYEVCTEYEGLVERQKAYGL